MRPCLGGCVCVSMLKFQVFGGVSGGSVGCSPTGLMVVTLRMMVKACWRDGNPDNMFRLLDGRYDMLGMGDGGELVVGVLDNDDDFVRYLYL